MLKAIRRWINRTAGLFRSRARMREATERAERRTARIIESVTDRFYSLDRDWRFVYLNRRAEEFYGRSREQLLGRSLWDEFPDAVDSPFYHGFKLAVERNEPITLEAPSTVQPGRWVEAHAYPSRDGLSVFTRDITDRKRAEAELEVQKAYFEQLFEHSPVGIAILDEDDLVLRVNTEFTRTFGYSPEEAVGHQLADLIVPAEERDPARSLTRRVAAGNRLSTEAVRVRKDGTTIAVAILAVPIRAGDRTCVYGIYRDITEQKELEEQLLQSQKMEAVGRLAGGIAHDFNNLMMTVSGYAALLLEDVDGESELRPDLEEIRRAADRATSITRQLLTFSRRQETAPRVIRLNAVIGEMEYMLRRLIGEDIQLETDLLAKPDTVMADPAQIEQIVMNLAINARDAMPEGGRLWIGTRATELGRRGGLEESPCPSAGEYVTLTVADTGHGMDEATRQRIFEPFFTTKEVGHGTGLGLSTVYGIVERSGGTIEVDSEPGDGAAFHVSLPRVSTGTAAASEAADGAAGAPFDGAANEGAIGD